MTTTDEARASEVRQRAERVANAGDAVARALGYPTGFLAERFAFMDDAYEWRRLFAEVLGTFFLVFVAAGAAMVDARFGGNVVSPATQVTVPGLMVAAIILSMGSVSGAHLNPVVTLAFALRSDFPWRRVPLYLVAQAAGAAAAAGALVALVGAQGTAGLTLPGEGVSAMRAMWWEAVLTFGLVTVILGTASGAQNVGAAGSGRGRRLHRAGGPHRVADERGVDEPVPVAGAGAGAVGVEGLVGVPCGAAGRGAAGGRGGVGAARAGRRVLRTEGGAGRAGLAVAPGPGDVPHPGCAG
nr:aquaporin [Tepidiforma sp.]